MQIRKIKSIWCYMNKQTTKTLVYATVLSRFDYCNGVHIGLLVHKLLVMHKQFT